MNELFQHYLPYIIPAAIGAGGWLVNNVASAAVGSLEAPTKDSTPKYQFWFKFLNTVIGNIQRAKSTALEQSPNFHDAVKTAVDRRTVVMDGQLLPEEKPKQ